MTKNEVTTNPNEEVEENEEETLKDVMSEFIKTLNELPDDVIEQLSNNLDELDEYNKTHPLDEE